MPRETTLTEDLADILRARIRTLETVRDLVFNPSDDFVDHINGRISAAEAELWQLNAA